MNAIDEEIRRTDSLLNDCRTETRLAVSGVANVETPTLLAKTIPTNSWTPINAGVKITNVSSIVRSLGGESLYGKKSHVAIRELIQNAADAVRARRILEERPDSWGDIDVSLSEQGGRYLLTVSDNGIGMSMETISSKLLDFGASYWKSELARKELPTLYTKGFRSTGRFGIGFFSSFMLGESVRVLTRRPSSASNQTIELIVGLSRSERPMVSFAEPLDQLRDPGTNVRILLSQEVTDDLRSKLDDKYNAFSMICERIAPSLDVNLTARDPDGRSNEIKANSWKEIDGRSLLLRSLPEIIYSKDDADDVDEYLDSNGPNVRDIMDASGKIVARGCLEASQRFAMNARGKITLGGFHGTSMRTLAGLFEGTTDSASRDTCQIAHPLKQYEPWFMEQINIILEKDKASKNIEGLMDFLVQIGLPRGDIPFITSRDGILSLDEFKGRIEDQDTVMLDYAFQLDGFLKSSESESGSSCIFPNVYGISAGTTSILTGDRTPFRAGPWGDLYLHGPEYYLISEVLKVWRINKDVKNLFEEGKFRKRVPVCQVGENVFYSKVYVLNRNEI